MPTLRLLCMRPLETWSKEAQRAYLAASIDTDGWIGLRQTRRTDGSTRLTPSVGATNASKDFLLRLATIASVPPNMSTNGHVGRDSRGIVTRAPVYQSYWRSPLHVLPLLELAEPYLLAKRDRALWVIEFCRSRITPAGHVARKGSPYTDRSWELAALVCEANGRSHQPVQRPA